MNEPATPKTPEPDGRVIAAGTLTQRGARAPTAAAPDSAVAAIHESLRKQSAIVQTGPAMRVIPRREVNQDGTLKSNSTLRRRAARDKE